MFAQSRSEPTTKGYTLPAPVGGIDSLNSLYGMSPTTAIYSYNIDATEYGCRVRPGYAEWANGAVGDGVLTVMPFTGSRKDGGLDKLLVATNDGVYDVTAEGETTPTKLLDWPSKIDPAGTCVYTQFTNDAGENFLLIADEVNGYYLYTESTGLITQGILTGGPAPEDVVFVVVWKQRVWFIEENTAKGWYTDIGTLSGTITSFNFGSKFRRGGNLVSLHNWSRDSGIGPDDYLVGVSSGGDVLVYAGTDPTAATTFGVVGLWFIGAPPPLSRRIGDEFGGDLLLLTRYGLTSMNAVMNGSTLNSVEANVTAKIQRFLNNRMDESYELPGWEIRLYPKENRILINTPFIVGKENIIFVMNTNVASWSIWRGLPYFTGDSWKGEFYFGTGAADNRVEVFRGNVDDVRIGGTPSPKPISFSLLTSYQDFNEPALYKRAHIIRPVWITDQTLPSYNVQARFDFDIREVTVAPTPITGVGATWDSAVWDSDVWAGQGSTSSTPLGATGMGRTVAVALLGESISQNILAGIDVLWDSGGYL